MYDIYCKADDEAQRIAVHSQQAIPRWMAEQDEWRKLGTVSSLDPDLDMQMRNLGYATFEDKSRLSNLLPVKVIDNLPGPKLGLISAALVATALAAAFIVLTRQKPAADDWRSQARRMARRDWW